MYADNSVIVDDFYAYIETFYCSGTYKYRDMPMNRSSSITDPLRLPVYKSDWVKNHGELYFDKLLPEFLEYAEVQGTDLIKWNRRNEKVPFRDKLNELVESFEEIISPCIFEGNAYFVRLEPKDISGLPRDVDNRESFLETSQLFSYRYISVSEENFFKILVHYYNLHSSYSQTLDRNSKLTIALLIVLALCMFLAFLIFKA